MGSQPAPQSLCSVYLGYALPFTTTCFVGFLRPRRFLVGFRRWPQGQD